MGSDIEGLYRLDIEKRRKRVIEESGVDPELMRGIDFGSASPSLLDGMIENVIGSFELPLGIATNFRINGRDRLIPMVIEEPSVVAAASRSAKLARIRGGFTATSTEQVMIGQIQVVDLGDPEEAACKVKERKKELIDLANSKDPLLVSSGGGAEDIETRIIDTLYGKHLVLHLLVDCRDAMGANAVNTMAEALAPEIESITGGKVVLRILSNLAEKRLSSARAVFEKNALGGEEVVEAILRAWALAAADPYRAATNNKGIMNGVTAVVRATGNDTRAVEAGAHAYASMGGAYRSLGRYSLDEEKNLVGELTIPTAVGIVGGTTGVHPAARASIGIMGIKTAKELGEVLASVGLAQNLAALSVLATEGIQRGHMRLHARNLAIQAGAEGDEIEMIVEKMADENAVTASRAKKLLVEKRGSA